MVFAASFEETKRSVTSRSAARWTCALAWVCRSGPISAHYPRSSGSDCHQRPLPDGLQQGAGESLETWRDRLQQQFRVPFVLGALSDLKLPYVEIINPLLSDSIVDFIRQLPDALRTNKVLLRRFAVR